MLTVVAITLEGRMQSEEGMGERMMVRCERAGKKAVQLTKEKRVGRMWCHVEPSLWHL